MHPGGLFSPHTACSLRGTVRFPGRLLLHLRKAYFFQTHRFVIPSRTIHHSVTCQHDQTAQIIQTVGRASQSLFRHLSLKLYCITGKIAFSKINALTALLFPHKPVYLTGGLLPPINTGDPVVHAALAVTGFYFDKTLSVSFLSIWVLIYIRNKSPISSQIFFLQYQLFRKVYERKKLLEPSIKTKRKSF